MLQEFKQYIVEQKLFAVNDKILLAVSGGIDSVVMVHLFQQAKFSFAIAHCNFKLRKEASEQDEAFAKKIAEKYKVDFYSESFETKDYASKHKISIQMAARALRYEWLEKTRQRSGCVFISTAHHLNDSIETVLLNITTGTGIQGLHGILPKSGKIIRPLLFAKKAAIKQFASEHKISFREDQSNEENKYLRNKIRLEVIPILKQINPDLENTFVQNLRNFKDAEIIYKEAIGQYKKELLENRGGTIYIPIRKLLKYQPVLTILYELLKNYAFNKYQVEAIFSCLQKEESKQFLSSDYRLIKDRKFLILSSLKDSDFHSILITENDRLVEGTELKLKLDKKPISKDFKIPKSNNIACIDTRKISFPLTLRKWEKGDYFYPLGMYKKNNPSKVGKKKLSDFFTNIKLSQIDKEKVWVLVSGKQIVWVVGYRLDDRFKINNFTQESLKITLI